MFITGTLNAMYTSCSQYHVFDGLTPFITHVQPFENVSTVVVVYLWSTSLPRVQLHFNTTYERLSTLS